MLLTVGSRLRRSALVVVVALLASVLALVGEVTGPSVASADEAPTVTGEACAPGVGVTVVVDYHGLGEVEIGCAPGEQANGFEALTNAGFTINEKPGALDGTICQIRGLPEQGFPYCWTTGGFWSYWKSDGTQSWGFSEVGAGDGPLAVDSVEGWSWALFSAGAAGSPRLSVADLDDHRSEPPSTGEGTNDVVMSWDGAFWGGINVNIQDYFNPGSTRSLGSYSGAAESPFNLTEGAQYAQPEGAGLVADGFYEIIFMPQVAVGTGTESPTVTGYVINGETVDLGSARTGNWEGIALGGEGHEANQGLTACVRWATNGQFPTLRVRNFEGECASGRAAEQNITHAYAGDLTVELVSGLYAGLNATPAFRDGVTSPGATLVRQVGQTYQQGSNLVGESGNLTLANTFVDPDASIGGGLGYQIRTSADAGETWTDWSAPVTNQNDAVLRFTPPAIGTYRIEFRAIDGFGATSPSFAFTLHAIGAPVLADGVGPTATADLTFGDPDTGTYTVDLTTVFATPEGNVAPYDDLATETTEHGATTRRPTWTVRVDGAAASTSSSAYDYDIDGSVLTFTPLQSKDFTLVVTAANSKGHSDSSVSWTLTVSARRADNTAPTLSGEASTTLELHQGLGYTPDLAAIFADADGDPLSYTAVVNGGESQAITPGWSYTPTTPGTDIVVLTASDASATSPPYTATIAVLPTSTRRVVVDVDEGAGATFQYNVQRFGPNTDGTIASQFSTGNVQSTTSAPFVIDHPTDLNAITTITRGHDAGYTFAGWWVNGTFIPVPTEATALTEVTGAATNGWSVCVIATAAQISNGQYQLRAANAPECPVAVAAARTSWDARRAITGDLVIEPVYEPTEAPTETFTLTAESSDEAQGTVLVERVRANKWRATATAADGYAFSAWSDGVTSPVRTLTLTADQHLTANFLKLATVRVEAGPPFSPSAMDFVLRSGNTGSFDPSTGLGQITSQRLGQPYDYGALRPDVPLYLSAMIWAWDPAVYAQIGYTVNGVLVPVSAVPTTGPGVAPLMDLSVEAGVTARLSQGTTQNGVPLYSLQLQNVVNWSGSPTYTGPVYPLPADLEIVPVFTTLAGDELTATVHSSNPSAGTVSASRVDDTRDVWQLKATPTAGNKFTGWDDGYPYPDRVVVLSESSEFTANFGEDAEFSAGVETDPDVESVSATIERTGENTRTLRAFSTTDYSFSHWSLNGETVSTDATYHVTLTGNSTFVAHFVPLTVQLQGDAVGVAPAPDTYRAANSPEALAGEVYPAIGGPKPSYFTAGALEPSGLTSSPVDAWDNATLWFRIGYEKPVTGLVEVAVYAGDGADGTPIGTAAWTGLANANPNQGQGVVRVPVHSLPLTDEVTVAFTVDGADPVTKTYPVAAAAVRDNGHHEARAAAVADVLDAYADSRARNTNFHGSPHIMTTVEMKNAATAIAKAGGADEVAAAHEHWVKVLTDTGNRIFHSGSRVTMNGTVVTLPAGSVAAQYAVASFEQRYPGNWTFRSAYGGGAFGNFRINTPEDTGTVTGDGPFGGTYVIYDQACMNASTGADQFGGGNACPYTNGIGIQTLGDGWFSTFGAGGSPVQWSFANADPAVWNKVWYSWPGRLGWTLGELREAFDDAELNTHEAYTFAIAHQDPLGEEYEAAHKSLRLEFLDFLYRKSNAETRDVIRAIDALDASAPDASAVAAARSAYDGLSAGEKAEVFNYGDLTAAESTLLGGDAAEAHEIDLLIEAIGGVDYTQGARDRMALATGAYDAASPAVRALVSRHGDLIAAQDDFAGLAAAAVALVEGLIVALPEVDDLAHPDDVAQVAAARSALDALLSVERDGFDTDLVARLEAAEARLSELGSAGLGEQVLVMHAATAEWLQTTITNPGIQNPATGAGGEWAVLGLARAGIDNAGWYAAYLADVQAKVSAGGGDLGAVTNHARVVIALSALGVDPTDVAGHDLLLSLADFSLAGASLNGAVFSLIALDTRNYEIPTPDGVEDLTTRAKLVDRILDGELDGGGWAFFGTVPDPDMTAMALQALARHTGAPEVAAAVGRGLGVLSELQQDDGSYVSFGQPSPASAAQVVVALVELGIDPMVDARFVKPNGNLLAALAAFYVDGGGFAQTLGGGANPMNSEQGFYALTAYLRLVDGQSSLYDMDGTGAGGGDTTAPVVAITSAPSGTVTSGDVIVAFTVDDVTATVDYRLNGGAWVPAAGSPLVLGGLDDGTYTIEIRATDPAGNHASAITSWTVKASTPGGGGGGGGAPAPGGEDPAEPDPEVGSDSAGSFESWAQSAFDDLLGRAPSGAELADLVARLEAGESYGSIARELATSDAWISGIIDRFYRDTLGRDADPAGLAYWLEVVRSGSGSVAQVAALFYASAEYYQHTGGGTDTTWVTDLYRKVLGREPDATGLAYWVEQVRLRGRGAVASAIYGSVESRRDRVRALYQALLGREPDAAGLAYWAEQVAIQGDIALAINLVTSGEYRNRALQTT